MTSVSRFSLPEIFPVTADVAARYVVNHEHAVDAAPAGVAASGSAHGSRPTAGDRPTLLRSKSMQSLVDL
jgi:hypothetical protein